MEKITSIFVFLLLTFSCLITRNEGFLCKSVADCDPRLCRVGSGHIICNKDHKCDCSLGSLFGGYCSKLEDCDASDCPKQSKPVCFKQICTCIIIP
ncbi:hypothetical protein CARUB_v10003534mg [Capsella rubella]|uniref:EGF-like domain-containing protein n=1 Tax=Capsella rubella TaxID=81985 RepID=R0FLF6_9BRAS|nr:defensin-like protein 301 [Capsella rubella]EOA22816.1 hypothetical protein CARUB_v10003534mg [Capsella rubella]